MSTRVCTGSDSSHYRTMIANIVPVPSMLAEGAASTDPGCAVPHLLAPPDERRFGNLGRAHFLGTFSALSVSLSVFCEVCFWVFIWVLS